MPYGALATPPPRAPVACGISTRRTRLGLKVGPVPVLVMRSRFLASLGNSSEGTVNWCTSRIHEQENGNLSDRPPKKANGLDQTDETDR